MNQTALFFSTLGVIGAVPLFFLVAAIRRKPLGEARQETEVFLRDWAGIAPEALRGWITNVFGFASGFLLITLLAFGFNQLGDNTMPYVAASVGHFGNDLTRLSFEHHAEWSRFRDQFKGEWQKENPAKNFNDYRTSVLEKWQVRAARTLFYFAVLPLLGAFFDLGFRTYWKRGLALLILSLAASLLILSYWVGRKAHYVNELQVQNNALLHPVVEPRSLATLDSPD
jgi:hypothetical protein